MSETDITTIIRPTIFDQFPEIIAAQSTRLGGVSPEPFGMNLSNHVGDDPLNVESNRTLFYLQAGVPEQAKFVYQDQVHSASINIVSGDEGVVPNSDGLITTERNVFLAISVADCTPVLIYTPDIGAVAAIHAGWRGTEQMIVLTAIRRLVDLGAKASNMYAFIGACASQKRYEVGSEVATLFEKKHLIERADGKFLLDVRAANHEQLIRGGLPDSQVEVSTLCTISDQRLHSYRRDGKRSGRMLAIIGQV
jgi:purine-nucleoside/S-methyl-5'-thioadenosine phosphorylase / adenosine deaminase